MIFPFPTFPQVVTEQRSCSKQPNSGSLSLSLRLPLLPFKQMLFKKEMDQSQPAQRKALDVADT